ERVDLLLDRLPQPRMAVADMVHAVAVEIHVAPAGGVLDPDAFRLRDGAEAGAGKALVQEGGGVARDEVLRPPVPEARIPGPACGGCIGLTFRVNQRGCRGLHRYLRSVCL